MPSFTKMIGSSSVASIVTIHTINVASSHVLAPVIVIDRAAIERSVAGDATDLLRFHAGLDLGRNGGPGQTTAVFIRGAESNHTLVLVDGGSLLVVHGGARDQGRPPAARLPHE